MKYLKTTIIIIMFTFLIFPIFFHYQAEAAAPNDYLKIGLKYGGSSVASCSIRSENGFLLGTAEDRGFEEGMPLPAYTELVITYENGDVVIRDEEGTLLSSNLGSSGCIMPADYEDGGIIYYEDSPYRGGIMLPANSNSTMKVINYVTLEHYVYGVLNAELGHTNPEEALKAQAVAARTYAKMNLGKHSADGFDLCATTHCQVYLGYSSEYETTNAATDETKGEMICYNGEPVSIFYYKNSGGYTQNSEDVWTYEFPYLKAVKDEYCPNYPWNTSLSFDTIQAKLETAGFRPGTIKSVSINNRNNTGAVSELKIIGSDETVYLKKEKIRNVLGATIIKSNLFSLENSDSTGTGSSLGWRITNGSLIISMNSAVFVMNGNGSIEKLDEDDSIYGTNGTSTIQLGNNCSSDKTVTDGTVYFSGNGYGHGVGMPQDSAIEMAKQGFTYDEILKYFYTGIEIN